MRSSRSVGQQAAGRDLLLGRVLGRSLLDHGRNHAVVAGVPVGRIQTWDGKAWKISSDWYTSDDSVIAPMVKEAAAKYAAEKKIATGCLLTN